MKYMVFLFGFISAIISNTSLFAQSVSFDSVEYEYFDRESSTKIWDVIDGLSYWEIPLNPPEGYYDSINFSNKLMFRQTLHDLIDDHIIFPYSHRSKPGQRQHEVDTWDIVMLADQHPVNEDAVIDIYLNNTFARQLAGVNVTPRYDREHSWPKSLGFKSSTSSTSTKNPAYTDCHHLFAAYNSYNSSRGNKPYGYADTNSSKVKATLDNDGFVWDYDFNEEATSNYSGKVWQTWIGRRGDVARAMFYMALRYEGNNGTVNEADLKLTNVRDRVKVNNAAWESGSVAYMGLLADLLRWHDEDPVDDIERRRNTVVFLFQGNRNPFIDNPQWVDVVYGDTAVASVEPTRRNENPSVGMANHVWINEIHYDNAGSDEGEFVEIAGKAGVVLDSWKLIGYNGKGGKSYKTVNLSGVIPDQGNDFGVLAFDFIDLQNGSPDGIALIDSEGKIIEFVSYEGVFSADNGPAFDEVSHDIGVSQDGSFPLGYSLQRSGDFNNVTSQTWYGPIPATRNAPNNASDL